MSSFCLSVDQIKEAVKGQILEKNDTFVYGVNTDSRTIQSGELFIPLIGENFDGHNFLKDVAKKKAACVLTSKKIENLGVTVILVKDTLQALQDLAKYYRKLYPFKIIGITGSNGKTTTKFFTHTVLSQKYKTFASQKSFNNHFGVPLTLLSLTPDIQYGICEIGMNHPGEISALTRLAEPDISLCTTVGRAHLMDFGKVDGIYEEKKDIYVAAPNGNMRVFNLDNPWTQKMYESYKNSNSVTFSSENKTADICLKTVATTINTITVEGHIRGSQNKIQVPVFGAHNVVNLMGAAGIGICAGLSADEIWQGLAKCQTVWGRSQLVELSSGAQLIFDGYNANPDSVLALVENLSTVTDAGKKFFILGDMKEMGHKADEVHEEIGQKVGEKNFDVVCFTGEFAPAFERGLKKSGFSKKSIISSAYEDSLAIKVADMIQPSDVLVIKGSRGSRMERFVPHLNPRETFKLN